MNFLGIGPGELILILIVALIVFGPGKLPEIGSAFGKGIREFRRATNEVTKEFSESVSEVKQPIDQIRQPIQDVRHLSVAGNATAEQAEAMNVICDKCSFSNPAANRFCGQCGVELVATQANV
ncbi:MAG: twin-arginine translocase TatA/TatE family subunit [Chloroflexi bacterium]|nr:twin-arginine translocase TatA/TatE family subunit [Chloroflexota bacterium]